MANTTITNCTPHDVNIVGEDGSVIATIVASGITPRCQASTKEVDTVEVDGVTIPLTVSSFGDVYDLPEPLRNTLLIVSRVVADAASDRHDLVVPDQLVRNDAGQVVGARSLSFVH